jgi:hypothetical protein
VYRAGWYRCSFAADKGPAVCGHRVWYRQDRLEGSLVAKFREAMTPPIIDALTRAVNAEVDTTARMHDDRARELKSELRLEREAGNLVRFLAGGDSFSVRSELQSIEARLQGLGLELSALEREAGLTLPRASSGWIRARLEHLDDLLRDDAQRARLEVLKHLDGDLTIRPLPSETKRGAAHPFEIRGRIKHDSLLAVNQEAACGTLLAGSALDVAHPGPAPARSSSVSALRRSFPVIAHPATIFPFSARRSCVRSRPGARGCGVLRSPETKSAMAVRAGKLSFPAIDAELRGRVTGSRVSVRRRAKRACA